MYIGQAYRMTMLLEQQPLALQPILYSDNLQTALRNSIFKSKAFLIHFLYLHLLNYPVLVVVQKNSAFNK